MKNQYTDSVQNRFTAYLMAAVSNSRNKYLKNRSQQKEREYISTDWMDRNYTDFSMEFNKYMMEQMAEYVKDTEQLQRLLSLTQGNRILSVLAGLKEREKRLLFGRIYEELEFAELGNRYGLTEKQAEMAYYYVIRKIRKKLEGKKDEF